MHSSTSSSERTVPDRPWMRIAATMAVLSIVAIGAWEIRSRSLGYAPSFEDTPLLWSRSLNIALDADDPVVIAGASRIRFDLEHDVLAEVFGDRPVANISMNGSIARPVLSLLAADPDFRGTVLCGYTPNLFWTPGGPLLDSTMEWIEQHDRRTPAAKAGLAVSFLPDSLFAFYQKENLSLRAMLQARFSPDDREGVYVPPRMPPYICQVRFDRSEAMWDRLATDSEMQKDVTSVWQGLFSLSRPLPPELLAQMRADVAADVHAIRGRGGDVVFIRFPSTGWLREFENETVPRETHWEPLLEESGSIGIHFEDYAELRGFDCPEWSHLNEEDARKFSAALAPILKARLEERRR